MQPEPPPATPIGPARAVPSAVPQTVPRTVPPTVPSVHNLLACLQRMDERQATVTLWNRTREFRVRLRIDPEAREDFDFEIGVADEDDDDDSIVRGALELDEGGWWDEGVFVVEEWSLGRAECEEDPGLLEPARARLDALLSWSVCGCGAGMVKDGGEECLACSLTVPRGGPRLHCSVCMDDGPEQHMRRQACCGQVLHRTCAAKCRLARCPFCRACPGDAHCLDAR